MASFSPDGKRTIDKLFTRIIDEKELPCLVAGVSTIDNEEIYFNCGGFNSVNDPSSGEINKDSIFSICSQTKLVAHLAALQLIEKGKLQGDTPVSTYLPVFKNPIVLDDVTAAKPSFKPAKNVVRVQHLLNFSSGLFYPAMLTLGKPYTTSYDVEDPLEHFYNTIKGDLPSLPLKFEPGTDFVYGYGSDTLGFIVEKITGQTLEEYCQENIFKPLGMNSTSFYLTPELKARTIGLTFPKDGKFEPFVNQTKFIEQEPSRLKLHYGGIGLYSSMKDYLILLRHILQIKAGKIPPKSIVSAKTVQELFTPTLPESALKSLESTLSFFGIPAGNQWGTALALRTEDWPGQRKKGSAYWSGWAGTFGYIDPETGIAVIFATQVVPSMDSELFKLYGEFERIVYSNLQ